MYQLEDLRRKANSIRKNIVETVTEAKSGYPGGSLSPVEIATAIYLTQMDIAPDNVASTNRNCLVLSKGYASPLPHSVLAKKGLIEEEELLTFHKVNPRLRGHPSMRKLPDVGISTGSLRQGASCAVSIALTNKCDKEDHRTYTILGSEGCQEGQVWEVAMVASHYKLDNLLVFVDHNGLQIDGDVTDVMDPAPIDGKFEALGWNVIVLENGSDLKSIIAACEEAKTVRGKSTVVIARTVKGKGVSFMENKTGWHGAAPSAEQCVEMIVEFEGERK